MTVTVIIVTMTPVLAAVKAVSMPATAVAAW
jgi:hypothetical protein